MTYLVRTKDGQYMAIQVGTNHEPLRPSETFPSKQLAWKNIYASVADHGPTARMTVQDDTVKRGPIVYLVALNPRTKKFERRDLDVKAKPRYEPGKNAQWRKLFR